MQAFKHWFPRVLVFLAALVWFALALAFLLQPAQMVAKTGIRLTNDTAISEVMAIYGGLFLGIGAMLFLTLRDVHSLRLGLWLILLTWGGLAAGRLVGVVLHPRQETITWWLFSTEILGAIGALLALRLTPRS